MSNLNNGLNCAHISSNLANYEAARSGFFTLIISDINSLVKASYSGDPADASENDRTQNTAQEILKLNVTSFPVPTMTISTQEYRRGNEVIKYAGQVSWNGGNFKVDDVVGLDTKSLLMAWQNQVYNVHTRKMGRMADYKKTATLIEQTQDFETIRTWTLYGVFITGLDEADFDKEADDKRSITVNFSYDRAEMHLPDVED